MREAWVYFFSLIFVLNLWLKNKIKIIINNKINKFNKSKLIKNQQNKEQNHLNKNLELKNKNKIVKNNNIKNKINKNNKK